MANYTDQEYNQYLQVDGWTKAETDHLFDLCQRFDLRFIIIQDRWDREAFKTPRSVEDLKERYYNAVNSLQKAKIVAGQETKIKAFDAAHERKRKEQLIKQYNRTPEQIEEEQKLIEEMRKIEMRKREREKKTQDLQKLITAADNSTQARRTETPGSSRSRPGRKKQAMPRSSSKEPGTPTPNVLEMAGIKFPDTKTAGATLRSQRMKLPASVGQKKSKAIEQLLHELNIDSRPIPTEEICNHFNELRSDMVLLYELKMALANCEFELQTLKHQFEALRPDAAPPTPQTPAAGKSKTAKATSTPSVGATVPDTPETPETPVVEKKGISEVLEVPAAPPTPSRKRRAALEQEKLMKKVKNKV